MAHPATPRRDKVTTATAPIDQESIPVPAMITADVFAAVATRLEENRRRYREQKQGAKYLLNGLLVCHLCGSACCGRRIGPHYMYYRCLRADVWRRERSARCHNKGLNGERLEASVWSDVCGLLEDPDRLRRELARRLERPSADRLDAARCREAIAQVKSRMSRLLDAYESGSVEKGEFESRMQRHKERLSTEQQKLSQIESCETQAADLELLRTHFETFAAQIRTGLQNADMATKRKTLRLLVKRIEVDVDEIRIIYKINLHPFAPRPGRGGFLQHCLQSHSIAQPAGLGG